MAKSPTKKLVPSVLGKNIIDGIKKELPDIVNKISTLSREERQDFITSLGVGSSKDTKGFFFTCQRCGRLLKRSDFAEDYRPEIRQSITNICKECAEAIACNMDEDGNKYTVTKESLDAALKALDKPFLENTWEQSVEACKDSKNTSVLQIYLGILSKDNRYKILSYDDGQSSAIVNIESDSAMNHSDEVISMFQKNRADVIKLLGYEPFAEEKMDDQPFLYSQLIGFLDSGGDANEDMMRISSCVTIVRSFLHIQKLDNAIAKLMMNAGSKANFGTIKVLQDTKKNVASAIMLLAEDNCISLKHSKTAVKGEDTWTGRMRKIKELNLREAELNAYDIGTCAGMRQVADISNASIISQIRLDENDYTEMLAKQRELLTEANMEKDKALEEARILLRENLDLKAYIEEKGLMPSE